MELGRVRFNIFITVASDQSQTRLHVLGKLADEAYSTKEKEKKREREREKKSLSPEPRHKPHQTRHG